MIVRESLEIRDILFQDGRSVRDAIALNTSPTISAPDSLIVRVEGTHGGFVNLNGFFYRQEGMQIGYLTWTKPYQKAVLLNHDDMGTAIGRVIDASFVQDDPESYRLRYGMKENIPTCHIDLLLNVTNSDAIQHIIRGEYTTVSQSGKCFDIRCGLCGADILNPESRCDHERNSVVDGTRVYWTFGPLTYNEVSFVNVPSDPFAQITTIGPDTKQLEDSLKATDSLAVLTIMDAVPSMRKEEKPMDKPTDPDCDQYTADEVELMKQVDSEVSLFFETLYDMLPIAYRDKVLTTQARKALPASAFCGPERSFPVPDCGHVAAAKARLKNYKGAGSKERILSCINTHAKGLGCFKGDDLEEEVTLDSFLSNIGVCDTLITKDKHEELVNALRTEYEQKLATADVEKKTANDKVSSLEGEQLKQLAANIADIRQTLGKVSTEGYTAIVEELKGRNKESLADTLKDLRDEIGAKTLDPVTDPAQRKVQDIIPTPTPESVMDRGTQVRQLLFGDKQ